MARAVGSLEKSGRAFVRLFDALLVHVHLLNHNETATVYCKVRYVCIISEFSFVSIKLSITIHYIIRLRRRHLLDLRVM